MIDKIDEFLDSSIDKEERIKRIKKLKLKIDLEWTQCNMFNKRKYNVFHNQLIEKSPRYFKVDLSRFKGKIIYTRLFKVTLKGAEYIQLPNSERTKELHGNKHTLGSMTYTGFVENYSCYLKNKKLIEIQESTFNVYNKINK